MNKNVKQIVLIVFLLAVAFGVWHFLGEHKRKYKGIKRQVPPPVVVVKKVFPSIITIDITSYGTVKPTRILTIVPQVSGRIICLSPSFIKGGFIMKGDVIVKIDPSDYRIAVDIAKSEVKVAENELKIITEESKQGIYEWKLLHPKKEVPFMVSKGPQLNSTIAKLNQAKARLRKACLDLERTVIKSPFNGIVLDENIDVGSYVVPGQSIGTLVDMDTAEVYVPLSMNDVRWIDIPGFTVGQDKKGSKAVLSFNFGHTKVIKRGEVVRSEGIVDDKTRMIRVIIRIKSPYKDYPPFAFGSFVDVTIKGKKINGYLVPVEAIHELSNVWIVEKNRLYIKKVRVIRYTNGSAIITAGLNPGDQIVISPLPYVKDGMVVKLAPLK